MNYEKKIENETQALLNFHRLKKDLILVILEFYFYHNCRQVIELIKQIKEI